MWLHIFRSFTRWQVVMVVCVSPSAADADETKHVLKFSALTQALTTATSAVPPTLPAGKYLKIRYIHVYK